MPAAFKVVTDNQIATLTLSQPQTANCLTAEFWEQFPTAVQELGRSPAVRVIVLAAEGKHFCSGIDTGLLSKMVIPPEAEAGRQRVHVFEIGSGLQAAISSVAKVRVPVIAAVQGACMGAGLDLVTACDLRYCTADAFFAIQEILVGVADDIGALQRLPRLIPDGVAREMAFTGKKLTAERAKNFGFVSEVFDTAASMHEAVNRTAQEIAAKSPLAIWGSKEMLNHNEGHTIDESLRHAIMCGAAIFHPNDVHASLDAMAQKRSAVYPDLLQSPTTMLN